MPRQMLTEKHCATGESLKSAHLVLDQTILYLSITWELPLWTWVIAVRMAAESIIRFTMIFTGIHALETLILFMEGRWLRRPARRRCGWRTRTCFLSNLSRLWRPSRHIPPRSEAI